MKTLLSVVLAAFLLVGSLLAADAQIGGNWEMTMDSPHGKLTGPLSLEQIGPNIKGTYETGHTGKLTVKGKVDGDKILLTMEVPQGDMTVTFEGAKKGETLSGTTTPLNGAWSAERK